MKNVKVILISVVLCAAVFANSRIDALGGDAGFWAGDRANIAIFPATINDHDFVELDNVGDDTDGVAACDDDTADNGLVKLINAAMICSGLVEALGACASSYIKKPPFQMLPGSVPKVNIGLVRLP